MWTLRNNGPKRNPRTILSPNHHPAWVTTGAAGNTNLTLCSQHLKLQELLVRCSSPPWALGLYFITLFLKTACCILKKLCPFSMQMLLPYCSNQELLSPLSSFSTTKSFLHHLAEFPWWASLFSILYQNPCFISLSSHYIMNESNSISPTV